ncbi:uncharacterized protein [Nicotiana sylvestris]|uniref:uncharacterized protein n=1 Tax=Nicotiana sylvestris TaxID=4096 RepID=UPI00388C63CA
MLECRDLIEHQIYWKLRVGSAQFWFDNWTEMGALYFQVPTEFGIDEDIHNVNDLAENGMWNVDKIFESLPEDLANHIVQNIRPPTESSQLDTPFWMLETRGHFTVKSAWDYLRRRANPKLAYKMIWVKGLPFKIYFFLWKVWKAKLPLDEFLRKIVYFMPSKCWCCVDPKEESLVHMFFKSNAARKEKKQFEIWKSSVSEQSYLPGVIYFAIAGQTEKARTTCDLINVEGREISEGTNNESEAVAIVEALNMCKNLNYCRIWLQTDSMLLKNIIEESWKPPWYITEHVEEILRLKEQNTIKVTHIFREGNTLADHLANYALNEGNTECHGFWDLDSKGRRIINEDKMQCISSKIKPNLIIESEMVVGMLCSQSTGKTLKMGLRTFTIYLTSKGSNAIAWEIS